MRSSHRFVGVADRPRRRAIDALAILLVVVVLAAGCSSTSISESRRTLGSEELPPATTETEGAAEPAAEPTAESTSDSTAEPEAATIGWIVEGATWQIELGEIVDVGPSLAADDPSYPEAGRCYVLVGTLELTEFIGGLSPGREQIPNFYLVGDDDMVPFGFANCNRDAIKDAGYQWIRDAEKTTEGSLYPFHAHFLVPPDVEITHLSLGRPGEPDALVLPFKISDTFSPAPDSVVVEPDIEAVSFAGVRFGQAAAPSERDQATRWSVEILGITEQASNQGGQCYLVVGAVTAEEVSAGPISSAPPTFEFVRGQERSRTAFAGGCSFNEAAQSGYDWIHNADMLEGASYPFMTLSSLPVGGDPDFLILRFPGTNEERYLQFETVESLPAVPDLPPWSPLEVELPALQGAMFSEYLLDEWEVELDGALQVPGSGWFDAPGSCVILYGKMTAMASDDPDSLRVFRPRFFPIADGVLWIASDAEKCGAHELEDANYQAARLFDAALGEPFPFYDVLWVPAGAELDAIVHGLDADHMFSPDIDR